MKAQPFLLSIVFLIGIISCGPKEVKEEEVVEIEEIDITSISPEELSAMQGNPEGHYGLFIEEKGAITMDQFYDLIYNSTDTVEVKFVTTAKDVCKKKGCWMKVDLADGSQMRVTFKDYGFFVPLEIQNREVVLQGKAFKQTTSVEELQHFAMDGGSSDEEIAAITEPEISTVFIADGVMMK
jgi:hypothetical protein